MTIFWSSWVTILTIACWLTIVGVLVFVLKYKPNVQDDGTTGHSYDGIQEYDKPLPKWWLAIFWGTLIWGIAYFVLYPAIMPHSWKGLATVTLDGQEVAWTSENELYSNLQSNDATFTQNFEQNILPDPEAHAILADLRELQDQLNNSDEPPAGLQDEIDEKIVALAPYVLNLATGTDASSAQALKIGQRLFLQNCAVCHGSDAQGAVDYGYPNLTDNEWLYGGDPEHILITLHKGRVGGMAAWRDQLGEDGVRAAAEYVLYISGNQNNYELDNTLVAQGEAIFNQPTNCVLCHGEDAKGMISTGAPNLTDDIWLYGGDRETVRETIRHGRAGVMPSWDTELGNERIMLLAAHVYSISHDALASSDVATATPADTE